MVKQYRGWAATREVTGFRSKFEASVNEALASLVPDAKYEAVRLPFRVELTQTYKPDWVLPTQAIVLEAKGRFTKADRDKMLRVKQQYPNLDIRMVFQRLSQKVTNKMTVIDWCEAHGFPYCQGPNLPEEWIKHKPKTKQREAFDGLCPQLRK